MKECMIVPLNVADLVTGGGTVGARRGSFNDRTSPLLPPSSLFLKPNEFIRLNGYRMRCLNGYRMNAVALKLRFSFW